MMLKIDFVGDWYKQIKTILENDWGYDASKLSGEALALAYFNAESRRITSQPRSILLADTFICPPNLQAGWNRLRAIVESGGDVTPNLSKFVDDIDYKDAMLNDWGIYHFHLGESLEGKFVRRTGPLLFAYVTETVLYALGIYSHGAWADSDCIETIHRNWPEAIESFKINGVPAEKILTQAQRLALRRKNVNSFVAVSDGTVYGPPGGGMVCSGDNIQSVVLMDRQLDLLETLEENVKSQLPVVLDDLRRHGYLDGEELDAKLVITDEKYFLWLPKYNARCVILEKNNK